MKTMLTRTAVAIGAALGLACASLAIGDESATIQKQSMFKGTVTSVDAKERMMTAKAYGFNRTFNIADTCRVSLEDKPEASLGDIHPGQKVEVCYQKEQGVLIARQITQQNVVFTGHITAIAPDRRTLSVKHGTINKEFAISENCAVVLKEDKTGSLDDLKIGHTVNVIYESEKDCRLARKIEQKYDKFVGTIRAIDAGTRTVKAKNFLGEKKFNLARGCKVVVEGKPDANLSDLRIGDRVALSYEDTDGVLVANRIGRDETMPEEESAQAAKANYVTP